jgi:hypothetical protein
MKLTDKELQMAKKAGLHVANKDAYSKATLGDLLAMNESPFDGYSYNNITDELAKFAELIRDDSVPKWISVDDRLPDFMQDKDFSENVIGICRYNNDKTYMSVFQRIYVNDSWAWSKISAFFSDIREAECDFDDDYDITHWQPLPSAPKLKDKQ